MSTREIPRASKCGYVDKKSRRDQEHFVCSACGHALNADINAALNIARGCRHTAERGKICLILAASPRL